MKQLRRRLIGILSAALVCAVLAAAMTSAVIASGTDAAEKEEGDIVIDIGGLPIASGTCGEKLTWKLNARGLLTISGTGAMAEYSGAANQPWYSKSGSITTVVIESGVTEIGSYAFSHCAKLSSVTLPAGMKTIGYRAFYKCSVLAEVHYTGASTQWDRIRIAGGNTLLTGATVHFATNLTGITVTPPDKTAYVQGEALELAGLTVTANYSDGSTETITDYRTTGYNANTLGQQTIAVTFENFTGTFCVTVSRDVLCGDVNGDGQVDTRDRVLLTRYLADWQDCSVDPEAADVNRDGTVDARDRTILSRHLADWAEYSQLPYTE